MRVLIVDTALGACTACVVEDGRHRDREAIAARYREAMKALLL